MLQPHVLVIDHVLSSICSGLGEGVNCSTASALTDTLADEMDDKGGD
jgi:hypothetical protein